MIRENSLVSINEVLSRILRHPLLQDINLEQAVQYTADFIGIFGLPNFYETKTVELNIDNYRALLPEDLVSIDVVSHSNNRTSGKVISVNLPTGLKEFIHSGDVSKVTNAVNIIEPEYDNSGYKVQGRVLYTSFKSGTICLTYKAMQLDDHGFPYLIDNPVFLKALEAYIKKEAFTILFDMGKIQPQVLQHTEQQYAWLAGQLQAEFSIPSVAEMEKLKNIWCSLIQRNNEFSKGFKTLGAVENFKVH